MFAFQVVVVLQQVFALIQTVLSKWLNDSQVVEVSRKTCVTTQCKVYAFVDIGPLIINLYDGMSFPRRSVPSLRSR